MHIAFLTPEFPLKNYSHSGGLGTSIQNLSFSLAQKSVKVSVFLYGQNKHEIFVENGVTFHILPFIKRKYFNWYFQKKDIEKYINKIIIQEKIDILEAPDWTGITSFMRFKIPIMIRFHGSDTYFCKLENRKQKFKNYFLEKMAVLGATGFIAPTQFAKDFTAELFRINQKKVTIIPYGLQLSKFHNANPTQFDANTILYIGTIIRKKGVFEIPDIFKKVLKSIPDAKLILVGGDSGDKVTNSKSTWEMVYSQFSESEKKQVLYLGKLDYSQVQNKIQKANVCIFPSFAETLGMVTIESMAMQKAVVNTNIGWANELMEDGISGFLVDPKNHELFSERIISLLNNKENAIQMGKNARIFVENKFDMETIANRNIEFYKQFVS
jgi:glycosyltransferase involved in cell wall biosynthesis